MRRFPFHKQLDCSDCGAACLRMIIHYYGKRYMSRTLCDDVSINRTGTSLLGISLAAEDIGFKTQAYKIPWEQFRLHINFPCIIHWNKNHFVVVYGMKYKKKKEFVQIADPGYGLISYSIADFLKYWLVSQEDSLGIVLTIKPTEKFYDLELEKQPTFKYRDFWPYFSPYRKQMLMFIFLMMLGSGVNILFPFLTQLVVDVGIRDSNLHFILLLLFAQLILSVGQFGNELVRSWIVLHLTQRVSISFLLDFLNKLMRLPISFFDVKKVGDIMQRITDNSRIQSFLTGSLVSIVIAAITFTVYVIIMAGYNLTILGIFLVGSVFYILWIFLFLQKRRELDIKRFQQMAANQSNVVQLVSGMQEIKLNNCEKYKLWEWERIQLRLYKISTNSLTLEQVQNLGGLFIHQIKNVVISYLAARLVVQDQITLGMMMAMQYIIGQLNAPLSMFVGFTQSAQDANISLERIGEIYNHEDEETQAKPKITDIPGCSDIEFRNVIFRYERFASKNVLDNVSFTIKAGKVNAIVGLSGSGKTTILKLLLGFYRPEAGDIYLNHRSIYTYSDNAWRKKCGVVMQEGFIFSDTILNNIGISDEVPNLERVKHAASMANINEFITDFPLGYNTFIGMEGNAISSGQKQRILIARAIYKNPDYIFMDEATNSLDSSNEKLILANLEEFLRKKTVLIVAHRLSTIKNADQIIVLDQGKVKESGTHLELLTHHGLYYSLVKDQLELERRER